MKEYSYSDNVFSFEGSVSVQVEDTWCRPWRIDYNRIDFFPYLPERSGELSGVRLTFATDSQHIGLKFHEAYENMKLDVYSNDELVEQLTCNMDTTIFLKALDPGMKKIEIWLDPKYPLKLEKVLIDDDSIIQRVNFTGKRWVHHGSSISHSKAAASPSCIWTGIVARKYGLHLTNLGFGGQCKIETMVAMMIRDLPSDMISLKLGINCYVGDLTSRTFEPNVIGFINIIREKKPETPIVVISPIYSPDREDVRLLENSLTLKEMRDILCTVVDKFKKHGDKKIYYVDGLSILGPEYVKYLPDGLHPDANGQFIMAENFIKEAIPLLI